MCLLSASALQGLAEGPSHNVDTEVLTILKWLILSPLHSGGMIGCKRSEIGSNRDGDSW